MKFLGLMLLAASSLMAQNAVIQNPVIGQVYTVALDTYFLTPQVLVDTYLHFVITRAPNGDKTFNFLIYSCSNEILWVGAGLTSKRTCTFKSKYGAENYGPVEAQIGLFLDSYGDVPHHIFYAATLGDVIFQQPQAVAAPTPPGDPYITMLDGLGNSLLQFDLTNSAILSQVIVPSTVGPYGIRPTLTGPQNEYWVANGSAGIAIANLAVQQVTANIATPSVPQDALPVAIVFTNDGSGALEAFQYYSPDASGNNGLLLAFNAVSQSVTFSLPLKYAPSALVMSPDGLTAYLLNRAGMITYFDILSGTADLTLSTYTPGQFGGYSGTPVFVHPDGTRLFWNVGTQLDSFDIASHRVTAEFNSGLPTTSGTTMTLSQDGALAYMSDGAGDVAVVDTRYGNVLTTYTAPGPSLVFGGPPQP
jgi:hypothetical protein